jgi:hypothetical protein
MYNAMKEYRNFVADGHESKTHDNCHEQLPSTAQCPQSHHFQPLPEHNYQIILPAV